MSDNTERNEKLEQRICVIGAGPSGIAAAKNLLDAGFRNLVMYDRNQDVGGNWIFSAEGGHSSVFETTHIISSKKLSQYADYPMPPEYADYPSHRHLLEYFQGYARRFGLYDFACFGTMVEHAAKTEAGGWRVRVRDERGTRVEHFDALVVCNGHHWKPRMPEYPGEFTGELIHSHDYKRAAEFADKRVLVIGGGNSACDVAVETGRVSAKTDVSMRRGYWIVPKFLMGIPSDVINDAVLRFVPWARARQFLAESLLKLTQGSNKKYGMEEPNFRFGQVHPTINSELFYSIRHGRVTPRREIARYEGRTVHFVDGTSDEYDVIIACTGYWISHPFFDADFLDYSAGPVPLYLRMLPEHHENLYFVGLFQPVGCIWPLAELQAKIVARALAGDWSPPADLGESIRREVERPDFDQLNTPRHTITVDYQRFRARLLKHLPRDYVSREPVVRSKARPAPAVTPSGPAVPSSGSSEPARRKSA